MKFSLSNETQIEKFNHFSINSIAVDTLSKEQYAFENSFESLIKSYQLYRSQFENSFDRVLRRNSIAEILIYKNRDTRSAISRRSEIFELVYN